MKFFFKMFLAVNLLCGCLLLLLAILVSFVRMDLLFITNIIKDWDWQGFRIFEAINFIFTLVFSLVTWEDRD